MRKKWRILRKWLLWILITGCVFSSFFNETNADDKNWVTDLVTNFVANENNKNDIVKKFCDTMTWSLDEESEKSLRQSLFVASLCTNWKTWSVVFADADKYIKDEFSFKTAGIPWNCRKLYWEKCNVVEAADNLLTLLLSEMFTIREASVFGLKWNVKDFSNSEKMDEWKKEFIETYLMIPKTKDFCKGWDHKKTCKMLDKQMKQFKKAIKNLKYINIDAVFSEENKRINCSGADARDNIMYCWLAWEVQWWLEMFSNLVYNELEWYGIFTSFYWQMLSQREPLPDNIQSEFLQSLAWVKKFLTITEESFIDLVNIATTYPVHVTLVAYQEDLLRVRDNYLVKLVTPIYCLYYKLRNVQFDK